MRIKRVHIENFRSIKNLEFYPQDLCALVGENNAGKTNILKALNFLLGETWPSKRGLETSDYYEGNVDLPIRIAVEFEDNAHRIRSVWYQTAEPKGKETLVEYDSGQCYNLSNEVRERCALVYLDANRDLEYHLGHSRWTLYGRVVRQLAADFNANSSEEMLKSVQSRFGEAHNLLRTDLYEQFESELRSAFDEQIRQTNHSIEMEFRAFDPQNYYRSIRTLLREDGKLKNLAEAGQGMRNLVLLALFRAYARVFKGEAIIAIEEPEIYLHPHAQRSLFTLFNELALHGNQILYSTHSGNFIDIEHFDRICLVEKCQDDVRDICTHVQQVSVEDLLARRHNLHPAKEMNEVSIRRRYQGLCRLEHNEAFFSRKVVLVEGDTEEYSLPIFAQALGYDFDVNGISVVNAHGKNNLDQLYQLYEAFGIPVYLIFDSDCGSKKQADLNQNAVLLRMLAQAEVLVPEGTVTDTYAILDADFESEMKAYLDTIETGRYERWHAKASEFCGAKAGKGLIARFIAQRLSSLNLIPPFVQEIITAIQYLSPNSNQHFDLPVGSLLEIDNI